MMRASFFPPRDEEPEPPEPEEWTLPPWMQAPTDELPGLVPDGRVIYRDSRLVLRLGVLESFSIGVQFSAHAAIRRLDESQLEWEESNSAYFGHRRRGPRFGVRLPDGSAVLADDRFLPPDSERAGPSLVVRDQGGGGGPRRIDMSWHLWLWPFPPAGTLELHVEWLQFGISDASVPVDGEALREARGEVERMWPE